MKEFIFRFLVGGAFVSAFAMVGDALRPKSFAGLFGAAPSIGLATLGLTIAAEGKMYAATEARSMIVGAVAFFIYASVVSKILMRFRPSALATTTACLLVWLGASYGLWYVWVR